MSGQFPVRMVPWLAPEAVREEMIVTRERERGR